MSRKAVRLQATDVYKRFASFRLHGEWFKPAVSLVMWIQQNARVTDEGHRQLGKASAWGEA
jgi:hypothetical protein